MKPNTKTSAPAEELLSTGDVARQYGVSDETIRRWIRKGILAYVMVGPFRLRRITRAEADRLLVRVEGAKGQAQGV